MKVIELRRGLADIKQTFESFGVTKQAAELAAVIDALSEFDDLSMIDLVKRLKAINAPSKKITKVLDEEAISDALNKLQAAAHLTDEFDATINLILKDKRLKQGELSELARRFGGTIPEKTTKASISDFLRKRRLEMKRQGGLGATIDRMFGKTGT